MKINKIFNINKVSNKKNKEQNSTKENKGIKLKRRKKAIFIYTNITCNYVYIKQKRSNVTLSNSWNKYRISYCVCT